PCAAIFGSRTGSRGTAGLLGGGGGGGRSELRSSVTSARRALAAPRASCANNHPSSPRVSRSPVTQSLCHGRAGRPTPCAERPEICPTEWVPIRVECGQTCRRHLEHLSRSGTGPNPTWPFRADVRFDCVRHHCGTI